MTVMKIEFDMASNLTMLLIFLFYPKLRLLTQPY